MFLSIFDIFKIGIGPSSSHTMGPMTAAALFLDTLRYEVSPGQVVRLRVSLHGSLAFTGKGHATDRAAILGLAGFQPASLNPDRAEAELAPISAEGTLMDERLGTLKFEPDQDVIFDYDFTLPGHANGMRIWAVNADGIDVFSETYYSIGGGFVLTEAELEAQRNAAADEQPSIPKEWNSPHPFVNAREMLEMSARSNKTIAEMKYENEVVQLDAASVDKQISDVNSVKTITHCRSLKTSRRSRFRIWPMPSNTIRPERQPTC